MSTLVTGSTGLVGSHLVRTLEAAGHEVRALVRSTSVRTPLMGTGAEQVEGDVLEPSSLRDAVDGCALVFHAASPFSYWGIDEQELAAVTVDGTRNLLEAAAARGVVRVVLTSSSVCCGSSIDQAVRDERQNLTDPHPPAYYRVKADQEQASFDLGRELGVEVVAALPTITVGGPDTRLVPSNQVITSYLADPWRATFPGGCNVVAAADVAAGHLLVAEHGEPGGRYLLGSENLTWRQVHELIAELGRRRGTAVHDRTRPGLPQRRRHGVVGPAHGHPPGLDAGTGNDARSLLLVQPRTGCRVRVPAPTGSPGPRRSARVVAHRDASARGCPPRVGAEPGGQRGLGGSPAMKQFKTLSMVRQPREHVWEMIRDDMASLVPYLSDVRSVDVADRHDRPDGTVALVNVWRASAAIPKILQGVIKPEMLAWTDRAEWRPTTWDCSWRIEPHFMAEAADCVGVTRYEEAMGGRGTRIVMEGTFTVLAKRLPGVTALIGGPTALGIESFVTALVPRNFQKLARANPRTLERSGDWFADDCVFEDFPEMADRASYVGRVRRDRSKHFTEIWRDFVMQPSEFIDAGDAIVIAVVDMTGRAMGSGAPLDAPAIFVYELEAGLIVRDRAFTSRSQALEAAGLSE